MRHAPFHPKAKVLLLIVGVGTSAWISTSWTVAFGMAAEANQGTPAKEFARPTAARDTGSQQLSDQARAALHTIYYYAYRSDNYRAPGKLEPRKLLWAVDFLKGDHTEGAIARRNLAIAKLVGGARLIRNPGGRIQLKPNDDISTALQQLAGPALDPILAELDKLDPGAKRLEKEDAAIRVLEKAASAEVGQRIWPVAFMVASSGAGCGQVIACDDPTIDDQGVVNLSFEVLVHQPFSQVKRALDPQVWDTCNSMYFAKVYAAKQGPSGNVPVTPCPGDPATVNNITGDAAEDPQPPGLGAETNPFVLFEHFEVDNGVGGALFKNLLCITPTGDANTYQFNYNLIKPIKSRVGGNAMTDGGILVDRGFVRVVREENGDSLVTATKSIKFVDSDVNEFTRLVIQGMCDEVAGRLPGSGACCRPSGP